MANEKRLIDANALLLEMQEYVFPITANNLMGAADAYYRILHLLDDAPTVDAIPAAHSKWVCVNEDENVWMCDGIEGCGGEMIILEKTPLENGFHFCPYCGADMRDGDGDG